jgi:hypothetical protein
MPLSDCDKTPAPHGYGFRFHHAEPQRRVPCALGDMLAPRSADDIPPITPAAMESVQAALKLLADLVGDRDLGRFLGDTEDRLNAHQVKARDILLTARGLAGILRVKAAVDDATKQLAEEVASSLSHDQARAIVSRLDEKQEDAFRVVLGAALTDDPRTARLETSTQAALRVLAMVKRCAKCAKRIAEPVLGDDPSELCHGCSFAYDPGSAIDAGLCKRCGGEHCPHYACTTSGGMGYCEACSEDSEDNEP